MPVTVNELLATSPERVSGDGSSASLSFEAYGDDDDAVVIAAVEAAAPSTYAGLILASVSLVPNGAPDMWIARVSYKPAAAMEVDPPETGDSTYSFDTGGGTFHRTQSKETVGAYSDGSLPYSFATSTFGGAINVQDDDVLGVDVVSPQFAFEETHYIDDADVDAAYRLVLFNATGTVNDDTFKGFAAGEVLFLGARGSKRGAGDWEINFRFVASPNVTGETIAGITGIAKEGHQYLWVRYDTKEDGTAKSLVRRPIGAFVERVYDEYDFSLLDIGV